MPSLTYIAALETVDAANGLMSYPAAMPKLRHEAVKRLAQRKRSAVKSFSGQAALKAVLAI